MELELTTFFAGLDSGLESIRNVQATFDEEIAFNFNVLQFFNPSETKLSELLAFFLGQGAHGQKNAFLKAFLEHFGLVDNVATLLNQDETISVRCEDRTDDGRRIDITVWFENAHFAIGIEHKIYAKDQDRQLLDYSEYLRCKTNGKYQLLYLTVDGHQPSEASIPPDKLRELLETKTLRCIGYLDLVRLLNKFEVVCRADNVRAFIRDLQHYINKQYLGETFMGEQTFVADYLRRHPDILKHADALSKAVETTKKECFKTFWSKVSECLEKNSISLNPSTLSFCHSGYTGSTVERAGSPFSPSSNLTRVSVFYEPRMDPPIYITIALNNERKKMSDVTKAKIETLERLLSENRFQKPRGNAGANWCASVALPQIDFNDGEELCRILKDNGSGILNTRAIDAATRIVEYLDFTENFWRRHASASG